MDRLDDGGAADDRAIHFTGSWREYLLIAVTNLLLTIVTLGVYRFWAKARQRRYLWSHTRMIEDQLEWTGTGGEMFVGFLIVVGVFLGWSALIFGGAMIVGDWFIVVGMLAFYVFILWAIGFAQFRALRYRLSRTYWRGIRGGSDDNGVHYGWTALGNNFLAGLTLGLMFPRAIANNWNARIRAMSFGPHQLDTDVDTVGLQRRWMLIYPVYIAFLLVIMLTTPDAEAPQPDFDPIALGALLLLGLGLALVMIHFWALFFRKAAATFQMGNLSAAFEVSTVDWLKFYAKLIGMTVATLGFGFLMWGYLRWKFVVDRLALYGVVDLDTFTQSETSATKDAEGFADAFDVGAF
jgi:hypothetical protein